ncbi:hypothetical protein JXI42_03655 [bacterium]|nr:hypothetical protein [bacterium]
MVKKHIWITVIMTLLLCIQYSHAVKVSPGSFNSMGVPVGEQVKVDIGFSIHNDSDEAQKYTITPLKPSKVREDWLRGYTDPPEAGWLSFLCSDTVIVEPNSARYIDMLFETLPGEEYYNQHWLFYVMVKQVGSGMFQASVAPAYIFETKSKEDINRPPYGEFGLAPSIVAFENVLPGTFNTVTFNIFNNDSLSHKYAITHEVPVVEQGKLAIENRGGYTWIPELSWITPSVEKIDISPNTHEEIKLNMELPADEALKGKRFESLIFVEPDSGRARFVRVRISVGE